MVTPERLSETLNRIREVRIGVIGDFCLDAYWLLDTSPPEPSLETGKPTAAVIKQRYSLGGAGNIVNNLLALRVQQVRVFGVINDDLFGREMLMQLQGSNVHVPPSKGKVNCDGMVIQRERWDTPVYAKPYRGMEEQNRIDFGRFNSITAETEDRLLSAVIQALALVDAFIINQQLPRGIYSENVTRALNRLSNEHPERVFLLDSRTRSDEFQGMMCKINACEAARVSGEVKEFNELVHVDDLKRYARRIFEKSCKPVFITRSGRGILLFDGRDFHEIPGIQVLQAIDPVGAGDTTVSAIAAALASGASHKEAAVLGNLASAVTIQKLQQTGTASPHEILELASTADYVFRPELADDIRHVRHVHDSEIEIINVELRPRHFAYAIFDHDGTLSTLRQGWEDIMETMMVRSILGGKYKEIAEEAYHRVLRRIRDYIDQSTGIETIQQMHALVEMVKEFGYIPAEDILDAQGYKHIYNEALMQQVNYRLQRLRRGELSAADYTVKGAFEFLHALHRRGVRLYLASGTDQADVVREAKTLGYGDIFEGNIHGWTGEVTRNTKRMVVESIIRKNNLQGNELICFGDGPVELREVKRCGGVAVGIASDEVRRYGLNPTKRSRLIKAGADIVAPDFTQGNLLLQILSGGVGVSPHIPAAAP
jgi:bifunctional ADP-heptose synthase (sugar kinase/adenylyltransferase)/phosphoglycolate phosphatase-like HAD superfamily hydrolase